MAQKVIIFPYEGPDNKLQVREFDIDLYGIDRESTIEYQSLTSVFTKTKFTWDRLQEIKNILDSRLFRSALILALTIPDICGRIEYPGISEDKKGTRYANYEI